MNWRLLNFKKDEVRDTTWIQRQILKKRYQKKKQDQSDKTKPFGGHCGNLEKWLSLKSKLQE